MFARETMKNNLHIYLGILVFILSCLYLIPFINLYQGQDEGFLLAGAQRLARGEVIYRDFYHYLTPGVFVFLSWLFKIFGVHILVPRIAALLMAAAMAALTYLLGEKLLRSKLLALLPPFMILTTGFPDWFLYSHNWFSSALALTAVYLLVQGENNSLHVSVLDPGRQRKYKWLYFSSGFFAALTLLFRQDKGLWLMLLLAVYLLFFTSNRALKLKTYLAGGLFCFGLMVLYLLKNGTLMNFIHYTFFWSVTNYTGSNTLPYFSFGNELLWRSLVLQKEALGNFSFINLLRLIFYSAQSIFLLAIGYLSILAIPAALIGGWKFSRHSSSSAEGSLLCLYALSSLAFFASSWHRPDILHLIFGASLPLILFFYFLQKGIIATQVFKRENKPGVIRSLSGLLLFLVVILLGVYILSRAEYNLLIRFKNPYYAIETPHGRLWTENRSYAQDYNTLIPYLKARLDPQEPFIVIFYEPVVYFFLDAKNPLAFDYLGPQFYRREHYNTILETIKQKRIKFILKDRVKENTLSNKYAHLFPDWDTENFKQEPISSYLETNYQPALILNNFTLYQLKDLTVTNAK